MYYVYLIRNNISKENYIGFTGDVERRLKEHNSGRNESTNRPDGEWVLVYYEAFRSEKDARQREGKLKDHGRSKQELYKRVEDSVSGV